MRVVLAAIAIVALLGPTAFADTIQLYESRFRIDGTLSPDPALGITFCCNLDAAPGLPLPPAWGVAAFDFNTGLGTIVATVTGAGPHTVIVGLNHDLIPDSDPNYANDMAATVGSAGTVLWEIDEPGYVSGNLFANVAGTLDNANDLPGPDDVSWALGRSFSLAANQSATVTFRAANTAPAGGFYLQQSEVGLADTVYFSVGDPVITGGGVPGVPEPGTWLLVGSALALLGTLRRRSTLLRR
jgi:hypothetical protein